MVIATNRQRLSVTFSHGRSISLRFWMDKALRKDAEGKSLYIFYFICIYFLKKCCGHPLCSLCQQMKAEKRQGDSPCLGRLGSLGNVLAAAFVCCAMGGISYDRAVFVRMYRTTECEIQTAYFPN